MARRTRHASNRNQLPRQEMLTMNWLRTLSLQSKLTAGFLAVILLLTGLAILGQRVLFRNQAAQETLYEVDLKSVADLAHFKSNHHAELLNATLMLETKPAGWAQRRQLVQVLQQDNDRILSRLLQRFADDPAQLGKLKELSHLYHELRATQEGQVLPCWPRTGSRTPAA
jgi:hypothetical protein